MTTLSSGKFSKEAPYICVGSSVKIISLATEVVSSGGEPTPAGTSVFTKHNWDMGMGYLSLNGWSIYGLLGWTLMT